MIDALVKELYMRCNELGYSTIQTLYFGGGTPSILTREELTQLFYSINTNFDCSKIVEFTIEVNPEDISDEKLELWQQIGVNRLSIGVQSFRNYDLQWMRRIHSVDQAITGVKKAIKSGFENISIDLMYGLPELTNEEWKDHILSAIDLGVKHISAYCLTVERKTALNTWIKQGKITPAQEEIQAEQFLLLIEILEKHGFIQYEISNFSLYNYEAVHNSGYWEGKPYIGIGPSAHSYIGNTRSWNVSNNYAYMRGIENENRSFESEQLIPRERYNELILTQLRTNKGLNIKTLTDILLPDVSFFEKIDVFCKQQLIFQMKDETKHIIYLTKLGRLQADRIISELFF